MYTHPDHARRGIGRLILNRCEAAAAEGFAAVELMATMAGAPLYRDCGYAPVESMSADVDGVAVPLLRMAKVIARRIRRRSGWAMPIVRSSCMRTGYQRRRRANAWPDPDFR